VGINRTAKGLDHMINTALFLSALPGTGKDYFCSRSLLPALQIQRARRFAIGDIIRDELLRTNDLLRELFNNMEEGDDWGLVKRTTVGRRLLQNLGDKMRQNGSLFKETRLHLDQLSNQGCGLVVVTDLRNPDDLTAFDEIPEQFHLRLVNRNRNSSVSDMWEEQNLAALDLVFPPQVTIDRDTLEVLDCDLSDTRAVSLATFLETVRRNKNVI